MYYILYTIYYISYRLNLGAPFLTNKPPTQFLVARYNVEPPMYYVLYNMYHTPQRLDTILSYYTIMYCTVLYYTILF